MKYKFKRRLFYVTLRFLAFSLLLFPVYAGVFLGGFLGRLVYFLASAERLRTIKNLKTAFGGEKQDRQIKKIAGQVFENLGRAAVELVNLPKIDKGNIDRFIGIEGEGRLKKVLEAKRGAVVVVPHLGNWELLAAWFGLKGYPANAIARPLRYKKHDEFVNSLRRSKNVNIIPRGTPVRKIVNILKENQIVGILPDQDIDSVDGVFVDFFNKKAYTPSGPVVLAMLSNAPIVPAICVRDKNKYRLIIDEPIELEITGDRKKDILVNTQRWSDVLERYIRQFPSQWVWMHNRWKTQAD